MKKAQTGRGSTTQNAQYAAGWDEALSEIEHQALHWATPDHGEVGVLIAAALRSAVQIARGGGLECEHRQSTRRERPGQ